MESTWWQIYTRTRWTVDEFYHVRSEPRGRRRSTFLTSEGRTRVLLVVMLYPVRQRQWRLRRSIYHNIIVDVRKCTTIILLFSTEPLLWWLLSLRVNAEARSREKNLKKKFRKNAVERDGGFCVLLTYIYIYRLQDSWCKLIYNTWYYRTAIFDVKIRETSSVICTQSHVKREETKRTITPERQMVRAAIF